MTAYLYSDSSLNKSIIFNKVKMTFDLVGKKKGVSEVTPFMSSGSLREVDIISTLEQKGVQEIEIGMCFNVFNVFGVTSNVMGVRKLLDELNPIFVGRSVDTIEGIPYMHTFYVFPKDKWSRGYVENRLGKII